jgi:dTDP-4-amino-4,6-dideoxygalactose transaminase
MCVFSFHPVKTITTAEGGAVTTNSKQHADALRRFRNHGIEQRPDIAGWHYEIRELGFNYRLTDLQAALGTSQLRKCDSFVTRRNALAEGYAAQLGDGVGHPPRPTSGFRHSYHLYPIRVPDRRRVYDAMRGDGIGVQVHYIPIYRHPLFADVSPGPQAFPNTEAAADALLSLPLHPSLSDDEQATVVASLGRALAQ